MSPSDLGRRVAAHSADLIALRHELHQMPEVGNDLPKTTARVRREFEALGLEIHDAKTVTGFAAVLRGGATPTPESGPTDSPSSPDTTGALSAAPGTRTDRPLVLLRADMDGLPVEEETGLDWASANGNMHACGHDLHMTGIVGAARALIQLRDDLAGDVLFLLQPGEEGHDGAQHLIDEGLLEAAGRMPDHSYGLHVWSAPYAPGTITSRPGPLMASSDTLTVTVQGRGGHGSSPHRTLDPVPVIAAMITATHTVVTREFDVFDPVVVTCGSVQAGASANVIPDTAIGRFTLRSFSPDTRERLVTSMERLFRGVADSYGMNCDVNISRMYPVTRNAPEEVDFARTTSNELFPGRWADLADPVSAAEDVSRILERIPGAFIFVSAMPAGAEHGQSQSNHSPRAVFDDSTIADCATLLAGLALRRLT